MLIVIVIASVEAAVTDDPYDPDDSTTSLLSYEADNGRDYIYMAEGASGMRIFDSTDTPMTPAYLHKQYGFHIQ